MLDVDDALTVESLVSNYASDAASVSVYDLAVRGFGAALASEVNVVGGLALLTETGSVDVLLAPVDLDVAFPRQLDVAGNAPLAERRVS